MEKIKLLSKINMMNQKGIAQVVILIILIAGLFAAVFLVRQTQIFKPKATFTSKAEFIDSSGKPITQTTKRDVKLRIIRNSAAATALPLSSPTQSGSKNYGNGAVYGAKPPGGFWDDNGPSGPGWYLPTP